MDDTEQSVALYDPGEIGREEHNRGDRLVVAISNLAAWLFPILMIAICTQVVVRQLGNNQAWLDDFQWWLYGTACLVGIGYAVTTNSHVRVDIRYDNFPQAKKDRTDIAALAWFFLPFIIMCWDFTIHYAIASVIADEGSDSPNGLHNLWILKVIMNLAFIFIGVATYAAYYRVLSRLVQPTLWRQLLWALPTTFMVLNLMIFYGIWWFLRLTTPSDVVNRQIGRMPIFDELEIGPYEIEPTILMTFVATFLVIFVAWLFGRKREA
ncbi:MAG: TRAP transporter small permease subunit [Pseudomonadota bacterium]